VLSSILKLYYSHFSSDKETYVLLYRVLGYCPSNVGIYKQAFLHNSVAIRKTGIPTKLNNERLEFLGDAILDAIIAEMLFKKFPFQGEGFLTEMRSKSVSRKKLAQIAIDMGLQNLLMFDEAISKNPTALRTMGGNALEALIGAIYLDKGYEFTHRFIRKKIIGVHLDFDELKDVTENFKSLLNQYAQKEKRELQYKILNTEPESKIIIYIIGVYYDGTEIAKARAKSKKVAEQLASEKACLALNLL
jgi:ribonuclease III